MPALYQSTQYTKYSMTSTNNSKPTAPALSSILDFTHNERESYPMKMYVLLHFLDRFYSYQNSIKFREVYEKRFFENLSKSSDTVSFSFLKNSPAFLNVSYEHESGVEFLQELLAKDSWFPSFLESELNLKIVHETNAYVKLIT